MNKLSIAINLVLLAAVGFLYYYNFSGKKNVASAVSNQIATVCSTQHRIAYVELDSLNENLTYLKTGRKKLDVQQKSMESEIASDIKELELRQNNFFQKNPTASPDQVQNFRLQFQRSQDTLESKKQYMSEVMNKKRFDLMEYVQKNLKSFLAEYNQEKKYQYILTTGSGIDYLIYKDSTLDITKDVIKGLNERMKPDAAN